MAIFGKIYRVYTKKSLDTILKSASPTRGEGREGMEIFYNTAALQGDMSANFMHGLSTSSHDLERKEVILEIVVLCTCFISVH